jgi:hypothetical protein
MQFVVLSLLLVATTFEYLVGQGWLPQLARYMVELYGAGILLYVVAAGARDRFRFVRPAYWILFGAVVLDMVCGVLANDVAPGPIFAGLRIYARAIPFFFLPAVVRFSNRQIKTQLLLLLAILIAQLPVAARQRMTTLAVGGITGDTTMGTLMDSSSLSIVLIGGIAVMVGLYLRKLLGFRVVAVLFVLLLIPTTINETKGTFVLLPIALLTTFMVAAKPGTRAKNIFLATLFLCAFGAVFIPIYDKLIQVRPYPVTIEQMFLDSHHMEAYMSKQDAALGTTKEVGRVDSITVPLRLLSRDPAQLVFGLGIGNASPSSLGPKFTGRYNYLLEPFLLTSFAVIVCELGVFGVFLVLSLYWQIYSDSRIVAGSANPLLGGIALGWTGVTGMMVLCIVYKDVRLFVALSVLFWYFSGLIAAERMRIVWGAREGT